MYRSFRFQLIGIVVAVVATILAVSQWVNTRLSERMLERDLKERALMVLQAASAHWSKTEPAALRNELSTLVEARPQMLAIDILRLHNDKVETLVTTRTGTEGESVGFSPSELARLSHGKTVISLRSPPDGIPSWRVAAPLASSTGKDGIIQVEVRPVELLRLKRWMRIIDGVFLASSLVLIPLVLALFLERRVTRPVSTLVSAMRQAEAGNLNARVGAVAGEEFGFLAHSLNSMLDRIADLTSGLEARIRAATGELAEKNRELQAVNEKLWHAQREVGRSERLAALGQMAATIAHEMGTPLNSVLGYTQLLQRETPSPEQASKLAIVESQVQRMIETIRSILDRIHDRGSQRGPVSLAPLVEDTLTLLSVRIAEGQLSIKNEVLPDLPTVPGNAVELRQVLLNVLSNAIDATEPAGSITVTAAVLPRNGRRTRQVELAVRDTGHGMSAAELRRLFEPFYTTKAAGQGTGLGLTIVDHIVRAHHGHLVVESTRGTGTTIRIRLPLDP